MARRGSSRSRRRKAQSKPATISTPPPVRVPSPSKVTVRRRLVDPASLGPGRRVSSLPSVSALRRKAVPDKLSRAPDAAADLSPAPRKRRASISDSVAAYRSAQLDRKPGAASGKAWRDSAAQDARNDRPDDKRPAECHQRPERVAKPPTAGGGSAPPRFVNWCR